LQGQTSCASSIMADTLGTACCVCCASSC
jgi:hypothetical protein